MRQPLGLPKVEASRYTTEALQRMALEEGWRETDGIFYVRVTERGAQLVVVTQGNGDTSQETCIAL